VATSSAFNVTPGAVTPGSTNLNTPQINNSLFFDNKRKPGVPIQLVLAEMAVVVGPGYVATVPVAAPALTPVAAFGTASSVGIFPPEPKVDFTGCYGSALMPSPEKIEAISFANFDIKSQPISVVLKELAVSVVLPPPEPKVDFTGFSGAAALPAALVPVALTEALSYAALPARADFSGAIAFETLPAVETRESFAGIGGANKLYSDIAFEGAQSAAFLPETVSLKGMKATVRLEEAVTFAGTNSTVRLTEPVSFDGIRPAVSLPSPVSFDGVISSSAMPAVISFDGFTAKAAMPHTISFDAAKSAVQLPQKTSFSGMKATANLPPLTFENVADVSRIKVMFPGNTAITPVRGPGVPLGAEKPFLEPRIKHKNGEK
ncbi:MAG: hypothetical protein PHI58_07400, partial [Candidatus Omnitrophica bacterium]|nr:hypothetical protein [Candidatus Omnitrophota bacterium]